MKNPCKECEKWTTKVFPQCRIECKDNETYLQKFSNIDAAMTEYAVQPYIVAIPDFKL